MAGDVRQRAAAARARRPTGSCPGRRGGASSTSQSLNAAGALTAPDDVDRWREAEPVVRPTRVGRARLAAEVPDVTPVVGRGAGAVPAARSASSRPTARVAERVERRIGFRRVEVRGVELLVNGRRVLIRGVNRHDFDPRTGRVVAPEDMRADVVAMKRWGFNAVRTVALPERPGLPRRCATSSGCTSSTRPTSSRTAGTRTCAATRATGRRSSTASRG